MAIEAVSVEVSMVRCPDGPSVPMMTFGPHASREELDFAKRWMSAVRELGPARPDGPDG